MRVHNTTDIPSDLARRILVFAAPPGVAAYSVRLNNTPCLFKGKCYHDRNHIVLYIGPPEKFPMAGIQRDRGYLPLPPMTREEALVYLAAHELRHLWQARVPRGRRVWGARGQFSERDACAYGIRMMRRWRRGELG